MKVAVRKDRFLSKQTVVMLQAREEDHHCYIRLEPWARELVVVALWLSGLTT